jgi:hypothetical protein
MRLDNDFSDILHEGKFDKHKPMHIALLIVVGLIIAVCGGVYAYLNIQSSGGETSKSGLVQNYEDSQQAKCIAKVYEQHKTPDESDPEFYPKLIAGYDAHLSCYDNYPDENSSSNRLSIESARQSAIDASGGYKDTYLSSNSYDYNSGESASTSSSTRIDPKTGCSYALTETEFIKCTDRYNASHDTTTSGSSGTPTQPPSQSSPSTPSTPPSSSGGSSSGGQPDQNAALNACLEDARSLPTEASRARAVQSCYQNYTP